MGDKRPKAITTLQNRVRERIAELGTNANAVSMAATGLPDAIRNILVKGSMPAAERLGQIAVQLKCEVPWLLGEDSSLGIDYRSTEIGPHLASRPTLEQLATTGRTLPVFAGDTDHTHDYITLRKGPVDYAERPKMLASIENAYALYMDGKTMVPRYRHGELLVVHPGAPVSEEDFVVLRLTTGNRSRVCEYMGAVDGKSHFRQLNPETSFQHESAEIAAIDLIVASSLVNY